MLEEYDVRLKWESGQLEEIFACETCGDKNAWDKMHRCCVKQCAGILNVMQSFPFAAWDDISAAPLDPLKVVAARKVEIGYAEKAGVEEDPKGRKPQKKVGELSNPDGLT